MAAAVPRRRRKIADSVPHCSSLESWEGKLKCGCVIAYHLADHEQDVAAALGIPDDVTQIALLAVAYTTTTDFRPAARPPVEEITYYDHWGRTA